MKLNEYQPVLQLRSERRHVKQHGATPKMRENRDAVDPVSCAWTS